MSKLQDFKGIIKDSDEMYQSAEVYVTILDDYVVGLFAVFLDRKTNGNSKLLVNLPDLKILREEWEIPELFSNIFEKKISLKNPRFDTIPTVWSKIENQRIEPKFTVTDFGEHKSLTFKGYQGTDDLVTDYSELSWSEAS